MPNRFDQFDTPESTALPKGANANRFDQFDAPTDSYRSLARNAVGGSQRGWTSIVGAPVDLAQGGLNLAYRGINKLAGQEIIPENKRDLPGGSKSLEHAMISLGGINTEKELPRTPAERVAAGIGEGAGSMVAGAGMVGAAKNAVGAAAPRTFEALEGVFGKPNLETAAIGATAGGGGEVAAELAPEGYKPIAKIAGSVAGGFTTLAARAAVSAGRYAVDIGREIARPFTAAGQEGLAARKVVANAARDLPAVKDALEHGSQELVPGSRPTTFQQTGDMGLGQLERVIRTQNPDDFMVRDAMNNQARRTAIEGVQPTGQPSEVSANFRHLRDTLDRHTEGAVDTIRRQADQVGAPITGAPGTAEAHGQTIRAAAQAARDAAKAEERRLWNAVDPDGKMVMPGTPIADTAKSIEGGLSKSAKPLEGEERAVFDVAKEYGPETPFKEVTDLRGRVSAAMAAEKRAAGYSPVYHRLVQLRGSIENAIDRAVENRAAQEQHAVSQGAMAPEDAISARVRNWQDEFYAKQTGLEANRGRAAGGPAAQSPSDAGVFRTEGEAGGGPGSAPGNPGVSEPGIPLDAEAAGRLKAASAATRDRAATFDEGTVGTVLKPGPRAGEYRASNAEVPAQVFHPGPTGGENVRAYIHAAGPEAAVPALTDYAAFSLRNAAVRANGSLDPAKVRAWIGKHEPALNELPPEVRDRFTNAARAEEIVGDAVAQRRAMLETFDRSALGKVMGPQNDGDVVRHVGAVFNSRNAAQDMRQLVAATNNSPAAREGLRRAVVDHIQNSFLSNTEAGTTGQSIIKSDAFQTFMRTKADVLGKVFTPREVANLNAVAADLQRANRSISATKLPGGSNTAQDLTALGKTRSLLSRLTLEAAAAGTGSEITGGLLGGVGGWLTAKVAGAFRDAGIGRVDDLVKRAMLDPDFARELLKKVPLHPSRDELAPFIHRVKQLAVIAPVIGGQQDKRPAAE